MQTLPQMEGCLRLAFEAKDVAHPSGVSLASYFLRAPTRGRQRGELDLELLFPQALLEQLGLERASQAIETAMDLASYRACTRPRATIPKADREWLSEAVLALGRDEGFALSWALLRAISELELVAHRLIGARAPRAVVRKVLHGVGDRALLTEPFAALLVRVLKIAQSIYAAFRHAGKTHALAFRAVEDRLWSQHPTGKLEASGAAARGAYLPSLVQAASGNARRRLYRSTEEGRTREHAGALLARFAAGPGRKLWPWIDGDGLFLPHGEEALEPEMAAALFFVLLTYAASERRSRGGPSGGLSAPFADAGFSASEWLPDRTDDLAVRLLAAPSGPPRGDLLGALPPLLRATLSGRQRRPSRTVARAVEQSMISGARERLPQLLRWLEEAARELLERM